MKRYFSITAIFLVLVAFIATISPTAFAEEKEPEKSTAQKVLEEAGKVGVRYTEMKMDEATGGFGTFLKSHAAELPLSILGLTISGSVTFFCFLCLFMLVAHRLSKGERGPIFLLLFSYAPARGIVLGLEFGLKDDITWSLFSLLLLPILLYITREWFGQFWSAKFADKREIWVSENLDEYEGSTRPNSMQGTGDPCPECGENGYSQADNFCDFCGPVGDTDTEPEVVEPAQPQSASVPDARPAGLR